MSDIAIKVENLSKAYQIGQIGTGTVSRDIERWWITKVRGKEDPFLKIGQTNDRTVKGDSDIVWSLKDINIEIKQGDAVGIIGRNGAGKSTLLKLLSRVTAPTTGNIKVKGRIASLLEVGTGFHPELSGRENIYLNGAILGMRKKEIDRKFDEIVDFSGVERYIDTPVKRYSSGMYVRLAFAVAAHLESEILIVDEVLAVGDAEFQKKCLGKMGEVSKGEGRTVLFVSHNMSSIGNLCGNGILLKNGKLKYSGDVNDTIKEYLAQFNSQSKHKIFNPNNAPGSEKVKLLEACVKSIEDKNIIRTNHDIELMFNFKLTENNIKDELDITFHLFDEMGNLVFVGSSVFHDKTSGLFRGYSACIIPKRLLNVGMYNIGRLLVVRNRGNVLCELKDILQFEVLDTEEVQFGWNGKKEGIVKPYLDWTLINKRI